MIKRKKKDNAIPGKKLWPIIIVSGAIALVEGATFMLVHANSLPMVAGILLHILILVFFTVWIDWHAKRDNFDKRIVFFPLLMLFALGPFGAFIVAISGPIYLVHVQYAHTFHEWYSMQFPKEYFEVKHQLYERIRAEQEDYSSKDKLVPFTEVMRTGSEREKGEAITKILEHFRPEFSPALVMGLKDPNPVIRVRSATAVARLEEEFLDLNFHYEERLEEKPNDRIAMIELAESLEVYAKCMFVDKETRDHSVERALALFKRYLQVDPLDDEVKIKFANLLCSSLHLDEALKIYESMIEEEGIYSVDTLLGYMSLLFKMKKYDQLRDVVSGEYPFLEREGEQIHKAKEILSMWRQFA